MKLDSITDRTAYVVFALALAASLLAAAFAPQDVQLGAWVRLVIWHGMLKWACIIVIFAMGAVAIGHLVTRGREWHIWAQAMQMATLPAWAFAVAVGAGAAKFVWGSWNWTERRMTMSLVYTMVAALALVAGLVFDKPRLSSALTVLTSLTMAVGLSWITSFPSPDDVHPASAVMGADNPLFRVFAFLMLAGCLLWVLSLVVPVRHWLLRQGTEG